MKRNAIARRLVLLATVAYAWGGLPGRGAAQQDPWVVGDHYEKTEAQIAMRDGVKLFVAVYSPKDKSRTYPILLMRTPYSCAPYGTERIRGRIGPSAYLEQAGYIIVHQDVRGRWMSEGEYDNMRPHVMGDRPIDESSDTYDTIEWLLKNVPNHNGRVGMWGISYPGFYTAAALPEHHPALVAASPQAPISDFFFDDFHHNGAYLLSYFIATATFGYQHQGPTKEMWYESIEPQTRDGYQFYMSLGGLSNASRFYGEDNFFWQQLASHPNYDEFWQARSLLPHLSSPIKTNVLTVGGFFDAEDLYGPLHIYQRLEAYDREGYNGIVMGPWGHGDWAHDSGVNRVGNVVFGEGISNAYQRDIEAPFFEFFLKDVGQAPQFEAMMFDTGPKQWRSFEQWPPEAPATKAYLTSERSFDVQPPVQGAEFSEFVSDPANPVTELPRDEIRLQFTPRQYMAADQRFATSRPDVLVFQSQVLEEDLTLAGDLTAHLFVSTSESDADWVVKVIDVYPDDEPNHPKTPQGVTLAGFQQLVRGDVMRGRFRNGFSEPEPFKPNEVTEVRVPLLDVLHTFKKGHRIMVHIHSSWFPLIDRCPQKYVPNMFQATDADFTTATHRVYHSPQHASYIEARILPSEESK